MTDHQDEVERLLRLAGPREAVPEERTARVRAAVHAEWQRHTRARARRHAVAWALAATAAAAAAIVLVTQLGVRRGAPVAPAEIVATAQTVTGSVHVVSAQADHASAPIALGSGDPIRSGDRIETTNGLAAFSLRAGGAIRLDKGTTVRLVTRSVVALDAGAIYIDSGTDSRDDGLEIRTTSGVVRDIGTQFEVRLMTSGVRVRVRTGSVRLSRGAEAHEARPGDELILGVNGTLARSYVPPYGTEWAWAAPLAPVFELEGRSTRDFLDWVARENGWRVTYSDHAAEEVARIAIPQGSIRGLAVEDALTVVLSASGLVHRIEGGSLTIRLEGGAP
jgi:nitrite reductase/ring-hydroxylating ferredoxin subunit